MPDHRILNAMSRQQKYIFFGVTLFLVFSLSVLWEFVLMDAVAPLFGAAGHVKSVAERWEFIVLTVLLASGTAIVFVLFLSRTAAGRERSEQALRESEARFRDLVENTLLGVHISARDGRRLFVNRACAEMFGYDSPEDLMSSSAFSLISPADMEWIKAHRNAVYEGDPASPFYEFDGQRKDGSPFPIQAYAHKVMWDGQDALYRVFVDITERRQAERELEEARNELERRVEERTAALRESEERYRELVQLSLDAIFVRDAATCLFANTAAAQLLRAESPEHLIGQPWIDWIHPDEREHAVRHYRSILEAEGTAVPNERRLRRFDGSEVIVETLGTPIIWQGHPATLGVFRDITERKRAEMELLAARDEAERANAAKSRFLAAASHDLRQPLQALELFVGVLDDRLEDPKSREIIANIGQSIGAMGELLHALLDISKLEAGAVEPEVVEFPVGRILENSARMSSPLAAEKNIRISTVQSRAVVRSDPALLEHIVQNFLSNAVQHSDTERILLGCRRRGGSLRIEIRDTGKGIPESEQKNIFEEFYQLENPARSRSKGVGLGLAIADRTARLLDHPIALSSAPGIGSVFSVEVPLVQGAAPPKREHRPSGSAKAMPGNAFVVVIEDDANILLGLKLILEFLGCEVLAVSSAEQAVAGLAEFHRSPGAILADYRLGGGLLGTDAIRLVQQAAGTLIPGIILTGDTSPDRIREARSSGFRLLHKPASHHQLRAVLAEVLAPA